MCAFKTKFFIFWCSVILWSLQSTLDAYAIVEKTGKSIIGFEAAERISADEYREPEIFAQAAVLMDGETGRILLGKNEEVRLPMASTTKIMTCILALENSDLNAEVQVSEYAASMPDVQLNIRHGETYRLEDLLHSLMLESHNDSAVAIAEHVAGSVEAFAGMMNQKARDIGCMNTYFVTPNGLDGMDKETGEAHATTAKELAQIMRYCILQSPKCEEFLKITRAPSHTFSNLQKSRSFSCINHNALLTTMEGALSGKTGFTNQAGYCYIGAVEKDGKLFIASLLACGWPPHKSYKWQDMRKLIAYGSEAYDYRDLKPVPVTVPKLTIESGIKEYADIKIQIPEEDILRVLMRNDESITIRTRMLKSLEAPVEAGISVGQLEYYIGDERIASYPIVTAESVDLWDMEFCFKTLLKKLLFCYNAG